MSVGVATFLRQRVLTRQQLMRLFWLALALALLWVTLRAVPLDEVWARLSRLEPGQLLLLAAVNVLVLLTFSLRWWLLLYALGYVLPYLSLVGYRGFGKLWCTVDGLQDTLGTIEREERLCQHTVVQRFERGALLACFEDATIRYFRLLDDGSWDLMMVQ